MHSDHFLKQAADFAALMGGNKIILLTTHVSPDGDAVASLLAAAEIVACLGSRPVCALDAVVPVRFQFLPGADHILKPEELPSKAQANPWPAAVALDCGSLARIGKIADQIPAGTPLINVDHHPDNVHFADLNIVYPEAASTTEILFHLAQARALPLSSKMASLLYTGLMTDTGAFRFSNTSQEAFAMATKLTDLGINPYEIAKAVYGTNSAASVKMLGEALSSLELAAAGRIALMTARDWNAHEEYEDAVDFALTVKGVQAAAFFRVGNGTCRVSLRSCGDHNVAGIARRFGGGGHQRAAGFTFQGSLEEIRERVIEALREEIGDRAARVADQK